MRYSKTVVAVALSTALSAVSSVAAAHYVPGAVGKSPAANARRVIDHNTMWSHAPAFNWLKRIRVSGVLNIDAAYFSRGWEARGQDRRSGTLGYVPNFYSEIQHSTDITVNNANLMFDARIARYLDAHVGLVYHNRVGPGTGPLGSFFTYERSYLIGDGYYNQVNAHDSHVFVDEAYATLSDFNRYRFYARFGREFTPFGTYATPYPLEYTLTQLLSQTVATVAQVGYVQRGNAGWHGSVYVFSGATSSPKVDNNASDDPLNATRVRNFGVKLGYRERRFDVDLAYLRDIRDVTWINATQHYNGIDQEEGNGRRSAGASLHAGYCRGPWDFAGDYVTATRALIAGYDSRIWAYSLHGGYKFRSFNNRASRVELGYERAGNLNIIEGSTDMSMPRYRIAASYEVKLNPYAAFTVQYSYNQDDKYQGSATGDNANVFSARFGVHF